MNTEELIALFKKAIDSKNSTEIDEAMFIAASLHKLESVVPYLCELLEADWHFNHEDIVHTLQKIRNEKTVDVLFRTATRKFDYLDYDNSYPLSRKCTWALADIGSASAKEALIKLCSHADEEIAGYAKKRIKNWDSEMMRKKHYS